MSNSVDLDKTAHDGSSLFAKPYYYRLWQWKSSDQYWKKKKQQQQKKKKKTLLVIVMKWGRVYKQEVKDN